MPRNGGLAGTAVFATLAAIIVGVVVLEVLSAASGPPPPSPASSLSSTSTCTVVQPGTVFITIASDTDGAPVAGAVVTATNLPGYCGSGEADTQTAVIFVTDGDTVWYSLSGQGNEGYSFGVRYQNQTYGFSIVLGPLYTICATLYVPSGVTNITQSLESRCPVPSVATSP